MSFCKVSFKIHWLVAVLFSLLQLLSINAFSSTDGTSLIRTSISATQDNKQKRKIIDSTSRRETLSRIGIGICSLGVPGLVSTRPALASPNPDLKVAFDAVRSELESPTGGITYLKSCIDAQDFAAILTFTQTYDFEFRKGMMGKTRKLLESKEDKEKALYFSNAVTFDLIGMNKNSRTGKQNIEQVKKYWAELKSDVEAFLALQKE